MKFSIKDFFSKCDQIRSFLRIWSHLPKKSLMENSIFCAVYNLFFQLLQHLWLWKLSRYIERLDGCYWTFFVFQTFKNNWKN